MQAGDTPAQRRLPAPRLAGQPHRFDSVEHEIDAVHSPDSFSVLSAQACQQRPFQRQMHLQTANFTHRCHKWGAPRSEPTFGTSELSCKVYLIAGFSSMLMYADPLSGTTAPYAFVSSNGAAENAGTFHSQRQRYMSEPKRLPRQRRLRLFACARRRDLRLGVGDSEESTGQQIRHLRAPQSRRWSCLG
jgi:hypothetical protein